MAVAVLVAGLVALLSGAAVFVHNGMHEHESASDAAMCLVDAPAGVADAATAAAGVGEAAAEALAFTPGSLGARLPNSARKLLGTFVDAAVILLPASSLRSSLLDFRRTSELHGRTLVSEEADPFAFWYNSTLLLYFHTPPVTTGRCL